MTRWNVTRWRTTGWPNTNLGPGGGGGLPAGLSVDLQKITPDPIELGAELTALMFNLVASGAVGPLITRTIADDDGNPVEDVLGDGDPAPTAGMPNTYSKTLIGETVVFTGSVDDGTGAVQDQETYTWLPRVFFGVAAIPGGGVNEAFVEGLSDSELRADKGISRNGVAWTATEYLWVAFPAGFNPTALTDFLISVGGAGFPGGFILDTAALAITPNTPNGIPANYDVWRSTLAGTGLVVDFALTP